MIDKLNKAIQELNEVVEKVHSREDLTLGWDRFNRWKDRTALLIKTLISENEAIKFQDVGLRVFSMANPHENFIKEAQHHSSHLRALVEDIQNNPELYTSHSQNDEITKQPRKSFWSSLCDPILKYKKLLIILIILLIALFFVLIKGWKFIPEINIPYIGKVVPPQNNIPTTQTTQQITNNSMLETSKNKNILNGSIYDVFTKLDEAKTTLDRQELFKRYIGLIVHDQGFILDISKSEIGDKYYVNIGKSINARHWEDAISCELLDESSVNRLLTRDNSQIISFEGVIQRDSQFYLALSNCILGE